MLSPYILFNLIIGAIGTLVQMRWTGGDRGRIGKAAKENKKKPAKQE